MSADESKRWQKDSILAARPAIRCDSGLKTTRLKRPVRFKFSSGEFPRLTHYLFRYPAKFHPPVARALVERYTAPGDTVLDPFCGSGSLLVEAVAAGRHAIGSDVDPIAIFVTKVKLHRYQIGRLRDSWNVLLNSLKPLRRTDHEYEVRRFRDVSESLLESELEREDLWVPAIPSLQHWFRRYVVLDLARISAQIDSVSMPETHRDLFRLCFASIIRASSNADPVPVSGLEVTSHMKQLDAEGRTINPFKLFDYAGKRALAAIEEQQQVVRPETAKFVVTADATRVASAIPYEIDSVITSPPYHNAVDYYRRHQLEMFWLGLTTSQDERLKLIPAYIGRTRVPKSHPLLVDSAIDTPVAAAWEARMRSVSVDRADAFKHYVVSMRAVFGQLSELLARRKRMLLVVGHSTWNGSEIPTGRLFSELAEPNFRLADVLWYPVTNRYMSYSRHNGANINREYVLVFDRTQPR